MLPKDIFQKHTHIGLDLDETLVSSMSHMLDDLHSRGYLTGITDIDSITDFDWTNIPECDMTLEELLLYWASHLLDQCIPVDGSQDGANTLMQAGKILSIVTARNDTDHRDDTQKWVSKHFPDIFDDRIFFANHLRDGHASKSSFCHQHHITLMIDDGLHNAIDLAENGIACILLDRPWNRNDEVNHQLIYRVKNWQEIIDNLSSN